MKILTPLLLLLLAQPLSGRNSKPINPIIGDQSYIMRYGHAPNDQTNDHDRIQTHLAYAEFLLRTADVTQMSAEERTQRNHTLDLLHDYWTRGIFPENNDYLTERQPCFIDDNGTICAVGYLVEQTTGREMAELISDRHMYQTILQMNDPVLDEWVKSTGLTLEECAIIQPSYSFEDPIRWYASYGVSFRLEDNLYQTAEILRKNGTSARRYKAWGVRFDWLRHENYSTGLKFMAPVHLFRSRRIYGAASIGADAFCYNSTWGMNLRPGMEWVTDWDSRLSLGLGYSYSIPIIAEDKYGAGRHDVTLKLMINLSNIDWPEIPKIQKKPKENTDQQQQGSRP